MDNFFKVGKKQSQIIFSGIRIRIIDISSETRQAGRWWSDIFKVLKENWKFSFKKVQLTQEESEKEEKSSKEQMEQIENNYQICRF